ncbi:hypothetical protein BSKO_08551 [Bryopsis sp. KO-2023]|nr:hypothetical protein BSKO_08551 [Bryopsis sp. KO-2023]
MIGKPCCGMHTMRVLSGKPLAHLGNVARVAWRTRIPFSPGQGGRQGGFGAAGGVVGRSLTAMAGSPEAPASDVPLSEETGPYSGPPRICILGGGFGGLYTAVRLESLMWPEGKKPQVTLIDQNSNFVFKPMLYELVNGGAEPWEIAPSFVDLLEPYTTTFIKGRATAVQPEGATKDGGSSRGGSVVLEGGSTVKYDWLVVALGAESNTRNVPGVKELAVAFNSLEDAQKIRGTLDQLEENGEFGRAVVVGGGYAGVELAAVVAEKFKKNAGAVTLVTDLNEILVSAPELQREAAEKMLADVGVEIKPGCYVEKIKRSSENDSMVDVILTPASAPGSSREILTADLAMWTAGSSPVTQSKAMEKSIPFPRNRAGAMQTEDTLQVVNHTRVFALGDVSTQSPDEPVFPATAQVAFQQADYVAWNLWASINSRSLLSFRYQHLGDMMSLGAVNAAVALPFGIPEQIAQTPLKSILDFAGIKLGEGGPQKMAIDGPLAALVRRAAYWYRQPTNEHRARVGASWLKKGAADVSKWLDTSSRSPSST